MNCLFYIFYVKADLLLEVNYKKELFLFNLFLLCFKSYIIMFEYKSNLINYSINSMLLWLQKLSIFISRLIAHTSGWRTHALTAVNEDAARCGPLFAVFAALRTLLCTKYVSALVRFYFY